MPVIPDDDTGEPLRKTVFRPPQPYPVPPFEFEIRKI
jgi:hypothetical protein